MYQWNFHGSCIYKQPEDYFCKALYLYKKYDVLKAFKDVHQNQNKQIIPGDPEDRRYKYRSEDMDIAIKKMDKNLHPYIRGFLFKRKSGKVASSQTWLTEIRLFFDMNLKPTHCSDMYDNGKQHFYKQSFIESVGYNYETEKHVQLKQFEKPEKFNDRIKIFKEKSYYGNAENIALVPWDTVKRVVDNKEFTRVPLNEKQNN